MKRTYITYTTKLHVYRLKLMLKRKHLEHHCPATKNFNVKNEIKIHWANNPCFVCLEFLDLIYEDMYGNLKFECPCCVFGPQIARRKSIRAILRYDELQK